MRRVESGDRGRHPRPDLLRSRCGPHHGQRTPADRPGLGIGERLPGDPDRRQHRELDLDHWTPEEARQALATLTARRDEQNATAEVPGRRAYRKAQANLRAGTQTYAVDGDT
ncbi:hypothetical protein [Streptomyces violaceus]|uniref:Uncharacterized protein n=1 Tax=Streptomyces violaceus TaxID=1936 RepID=A0ABY9U4W3_STRVL|nr:hypothetical protein [Streptomyces janthinus]WND17555.1 hypothetical protein RI060_09450 [Streptomyces janthinus]